MVLNGFNIISMNLKVEYPFLREKQKITLFYRTVLVKLVFKRDFDHLFGDLYS